MGAGSVFTGVDCKPAAGSLILTGLVLDEESYFHTEVHYLCQCVRERRL